MITAKTPTTCEDKTIKENHFNVTRVEPISSKAPLPIMIDVRRK